MTVSPGEAFGRRSNAWGAILGSGNATAGQTAELAVRARDVVGNALREGGSELTLFAFHLNGEVCMSPRLTDAPEIIASPTTTHGDAGGVITGGSLLASGQLRV